MADLQRSSLGRYRIDRAIGRGSMGAVFLGLDPMLGRQVAIKTMALGQEFDGAELEVAKQRFFREAETAGRLQHRDIVTIYDVGEEQELAYIAMEFLKGHDLQRHTQVANLLPVPEVLRVCARVADALAYAHSQGVVHRDVKPANVMLHQPTGAVKVTDFGIARVTDASRTRTGMVLGTPSFMSPEHLAGQRVDGRTDLYSLGVMLYQLLTGELPFQADSMAKLMFQIANTAAPDLRTARSELPEALAQLVARTLQKAPGARHADGSQLASELRAVDAVGSGPLWSGAAAAAAPTQPAAADDPSRAVASTVRVVPDDQTGHNSTP
jgi:serine/threonine-protein kinase